MSEVVKFEGRDGAFMWVEIDRAVALDRVVAEERAEIEVVVDPGDGATKATAALEQSLASIRGAAVAMMATVKDIDDRDDRIALDEVSLELGLSFRVEGGVIVTKGSAGAEASVTLTWRARPAH